MPDKSSFPQFIGKHMKLFGEGTLKSLATDKGYDSRENQKLAGKVKVSEVSIQTPANIKVKPKAIQASSQEKLKDRRAGIEPLIGHAKHGGQLGRSRTKSDSETKAAAYEPILGLNMRRMIRHQAGKMKEKVA